MPWSAGHHSETIVHGGGVHIGFNAELSPMKGSDARMIGFLAQAKNGYGEKAGIASDTAYLAQTDPGVQWKYGLKLDGKFTQGISMGGNKLCFDQSGDVCFTLDKRTRKVSLVRGGKVLQQW
jgi:hypothetical protein